jgi:hypothetical protein
MAEPTTTQAVYDEVVAGYLDTVTVQLDAVNNYLDVVTTRLDLVNEVHVEIAHLSGQMDIVNHSVYVGNNYLLFIGVNLALIACILMFILGKYVVSVTRKG